MFILVVAPAILTINFSLRETHIMYLITLPFGPHESSKYRFFLLRWQKVYSLVPAVVVITINKTVSMLV